MSALYRYFFSSEKTRLEDQLLSALQVAKADLPSGSEERISQCVIEQLQGLSHPELLKEIIREDIQGGAAEKIDEKISAICERYFVQKAIIERKEQVEGDLQSIREGIQAAISDAGFFAYLSAYAYYDQPVGSELPGNPGIGRPSLRLHSILVGERDFRAICLTPLERGQPPVMVFRGTDPSSEENMRDNFLSKRVGESAFAANVLSIFDAMKLLHSEYGKLVIAGHSLGGGLSQLAGNEFFPLVSEIYLYASPGSSGELLEDKFAAIDPDLRPKIYRYHHALDIVPKSGGKSLPTDHTLLIGHSSDSISRAEAHGILSLAQSLNSTTVMVRDDGYLRELRSEWKQWFVEAFFEGGRYYILSNLIGVMTLVGRLMRSSEPDRRVE